MKESIFTVKNKAGIHCRPSGVIITTINKEYPDNKFEIIDEKGNITQIASILTLLTLGLSYGTKATLRVTGPDEDVALEKTILLFENEFDFPPQ